MGKKSRERRERHEQRIQSAIIRNQRDRLWNPKTFFDYLCAHKSQKEEHLTFMNAMKAMPLLSSDSSGKVRVDLSGNEYEATCNAFEAWVRNNTQGDLTLEDMSSLWNCDEIDVLLWEKFILQKYGFPFQGYLGDISGCDMPVIDGTAVWGYMDIEPVGAMSGGISVYDLSAWSMFNCIPPFGNMFVEFSDRGGLTLVDDSGAFLFNSIGVLITCGNDDDGYILECKCFARSDWEDAWVLGSCVIVIDVSGTPLFLKKEGYTTNNHVRCLHIAHSALKTIQLMNCRNIELVDHEPDPEASRRYQQHFGQPLTKYKTLAVKPMGKRYETSSEPKEYQGLMPLHVRRGNFATYTDDAPLFGKYTGTFWRPATAVGESKNGVVVKDYKIKTE